MALSNLSRQARHRLRHKQYVAELEFFCALLLAVSENRARSLAVMEDFIADMKSASRGMDPTGTTFDPND